MIGHKMITTFKPNKNDGSWDIFVDNIPSGNITNDSLKEVIENISGSMNDVITLLHDIEDLCKLQYRVENTSVRVDRIEELARRITTEGLGDEILKEVNKINSDDLLSIVHKMENLRIWSENLLVELG